MLNTQPKPYSILQLCRYPPYGPFSLQADGKTGVPGIDLAIPGAVIIIVIIVITIKNINIKTCSSSGMCLGEKRMVTVPPRMGWTKNNAHHDTIRFNL